MTYAQQESRRQIETDALDHSMRVLVHCAEQDVFSVGHLKTVNRFRTILEAQQISGITMATALPTLGSNATPPPSFSEATYNTRLGPGQMAGSAFAAQPYFNTMMQADLSPPNLPYPSPLQSMPSVVRSDSGSTYSSNQYDWMARGASEGQAAILPTDHNPEPMQTATAHYHPFLQDFYRYEYFSSRGYSGQYF